MKLLSIPLLAGAATLLSTAARAHDGHGMAGAHWHATDAMGFVAVAAVLALAAWIGRGE